MGSPQAFGSKRLCSEGDAVNVIDENFAKAVDEIKAIAAKYDMAATVFLANDKGSHFWYGWDQPSWSCLSFEGERGIRIKAKGKSDSAEGKKLENTVHMLYSTCDSLVNAVEIIQQLQEMLLDHIEVDHRSHVGKGPEART